MYHVMQKTQKATLSYHYLSSLLLLHIYPKVWELLHINLTLTRQQYHCIKVQTTYFDHELKK